MDPTALIISAITTGAVAALKETAGTAVKDAYNGFIKLINTKFKMDFKAKAALEGFKEDPQTWEKPLGKSLREQGVLEDQKVLMAAQKLLELVQAQQPTSKKYDVKIKGNVEGFVQGDHAKVTMNFNKPPNKRKQR